MLHCKTLPTIAILSGATSPAVQLSKRLDVWLNNSGLTQLVSGDERAAKLSCRFTVDLPESLHCKLSAAATKAGCKKVDASVRVLLEERLKS
ncbi:hypothetical protein QUB63_34470 [Microcoleus sp. ARI1-B5]